MVLNNPLIRKIFGSKELEIIQKQINGNTLSQSEKNRLSRDIRPKFKAIELLKQPIDLSHNSKTKSIMSEVIKKLKSSDIESILLFGSRVDKTHLPSSDIDICVVFKSISRRDATKFLLNHSGRLPSGVDLHVFNILPVKVRKSIAKKHKILFSSKDFDDVSFTLKNLEFAGFENRVAS